MTFLRFFFAVSMTIPKVGIISVIYNNGKNCLIIPLATGAVFHRLPDRVCHCYLQLLLLSSCNILLLSWHRQSYSASILLIFSSSLFLLHCILKNNHLYFFPSYSIQFSFCVGSHSKFSIRNIRGSNNSMMYAR